MCSTKVKQIKSRKHTQGKVILKMWIIFLISVLSEVMNKVTTHIYAPFAYSHLQLNNTVSVMCWKWTERKRDYTIHVTWRAEQGYIFLNDNFSYIEQHKVQKITFKSTFLPCILLSVTQ